MRAFLSEHVPFLLTVSISRGLASVCLFFVWVYFDYQLKTMKRKSKFREKSWSLWNWSLGCILWDICLWTYYNFQLFSSLEALRLFASVCLFFVRVYSRLQHILRMWSSQLQYYDQEAFNNYVDLIFQILTTHPLEWTIVDIIHTGCSNSIRYTLNTY